MSSRTRSSTTDLSNPRETRKLYFENRGVAQRSWEPQRRGRTAVGSEGPLGRLGGRVGLCGQHTGERGARQRGHTDFEGSGKMEPGEAGCNPGTGPTATATRQRGELRNGAGGRRPSAPWPVAAPTRREATAGLRRTGFPQFIKRGSGARLKASMRWNLLRVLTPCRSVWPSWQTWRDQSRPRLRRWASGPTF